MSELEFIDIFADNLRDSIAESGYSISEIAKLDRLMPWSDSISDKCRKPRHS